MKRPKFIIISAVLMILLGLARGIGGITLLIQGKNTLSNIIASENIIQILAIGLILIGLLEIISAIGIWRLNRTFWILGIIVTIAFVIDGAINGHFLFGRSGDQGTIVNSIAAILIISCLLLGRRAFAS
jgi:hypothetical protein